MTVRAGQLPAGVREHAHHLGHDIDQHAADDQQRENGKHHRIDHRVLDLLPQHLPALGVVRQPLKDGIQVSGLFAGRQRWRGRFPERPAGKSPKPSARVWPSMTLRAHADQDALHARRFGLLGDGEQGFLQRQRGVHQGCQLPGDQCQVVGRHASGAGVKDCWRDASRSAISRPSSGSSWLLAQQLADLAGGVALEDARAFLAGGIDSGVFESPHQSERVTRRTSSSVVTPASALRSPSSRMLGLRVRA